MISKQSSPYISHAKYGIDLNESIYKSNPYLRFTFKFLADHYLQDWKKHRVEKVAESMRDKTQKQAVKIMDTHLNKHVVFYYGVGDEEPIENMHTPPPVEVAKPKKKSRKKKVVSEASTQDTLEKNLRKSTKGK